MDAWHAGMLAHSRLASHRRLVDESRRLIADALESYERRYVSVSGGKDSVALLHLVREVAGRATIVHVEDEIIAPGTEAFMRSIATWPGVTFISTAAPIRHSELHTSWRESPPLRPLPADTLWFPTRREHLAWYGRLFDLGFVGTRREESSRREISYRVNGALYWSTTRGWAVSTPLHRWRVDDIWAYLLSREVPYHQGYDLMRAAGIPLRDQRIGPPANKYALSGSSFRWLRMTWPDYWHEVCRRYPHLQACG